MFLNKSQVKEAILLKRMDSVLFFILFAALFYVTIKLFSPFFNPILWSIILYIMFSPLHKKVMGKLNKKKKGYIFKSKAISILFSLVSVLVIVIPISYLFFALSSQLVSFTKDTINFISENPDLLTFDDQNAIVQFVDKISKGYVDLRNLEIEKELLKNIQKISSFFINNTTIIIKDVFSVLLSFLFMIFTLYFLFADGDYLKTLLLKAIPIKKIHSTMLANKFKETSYVVVFGYMAVSLFQTIVATILFAIFGVNNFIVWGSLLFISSFIPMLGATAIWIPVSIIVSIQYGSVFRGVMLALLCGIFVSTIDNFLRPYFIKDKIKIHPLLIFFAILGGLNLLGFSGVILGPVIIILFFTSLDIFIELFDIDEKENGKLNVK